MDKKTLLLVGTGYMAKEYTKVLKAQKVGFVVVGRSKKSVDSFKNEMGMDAISGGIVGWLRTNPAPKKAIVAITEDQLGIATRALINSGCKSILVEKPGGLNDADIKLTLKFAKKFKANVFIAYNRRLYSSTIKAKEIIKKDGGVLSLIFDFTEWSHIIKKLKTSPKVKKEWFLANSTHVIDLAFFLSGKPVGIHGYKKGKLDWHPSGSIYSGAGVTESGALFSYHANWESAGRWNIEIMTPKSKLIFKPLEKLHIQKIGSTATEEVLINDELDKKFKPGIYREVQSFLGNQKDLPSLEEQVENLKYYNKIKLGI
ncbi:MAG: gfo/Idh/MocA family oxidoreductase [bacterium]|nr:gfo/Idh/MocA family oxidoreductase [bacterium]